MKKYQTHHLFFSICLLFTILMALFYPIHFMADDFEHLFYWAIGVPDGETSFFLYRIPLLYLSHQWFFPLFANNHFFWAKFLLWGSHLLFGYLLIKTFFGEEMEGKNQIVGAGLLIFSLFFPNNHEWLFWPIIMTNFIFHPLMGFAFFWDQKFKNLGSMTFKIAVITLSFFLFESYFFLLVLIELALILLQRNSLPRSFKILGISSFFILLIKWIFSHYNTYQYTASAGFHAHLFFQALSLMFNLDFYKTRWALGLPYMIGVISLFLLRIKHTPLKRILKLDLPLLSSTLLCSSYYFLLMGYSARRTLHGQIQFFSLFLGALLFWLHQNQEINTWVKRLVFTLILLPTTIQFTIIGHEKYLESKRLLTIAQEWTNDIYQRQGPIRVGLGDVQKNSRRGFGFTLPKQILGFVWFYLPEKLRGCVEIEDLSEDRFPEELNSYMLTLKCFPPDSL